MISELQFHCLQHTKDTILGTNAYKNSAYRCKIFSTFNRVPFYIAINRIDEAICEMKINFFSEKWERKRVKEGKEGKKRGDIGHITLK